MVHNRQFPPCAFNFSVVCVAGETEDFVVVFCFASLEESVGFVEEVVNVLVTRAVMLFCGIEGVDAGFVFVCFELSLGFVQ